MVTIAPGTNQGSVAEQAFALILGFTRHVPARHSGLAEIAAGIESDYPAELRDLASFTDDLASKLRRLLELPGETRRELGLDARRAVVERWSWSSVAERLLTLHLG